MFLKSNMIRVNLQFLSLIFFLFALKCKFAMLPLCFIHNTFLKLNERRLEIKILNVLANNMYHINQSPFQYPSNREKCFLLRKQKKHTLLNYKNTKKTKVNLINIALAAMFCIILTKTLLDKRLCIVSQVIKSRYCCCCKHMYLCVFTFVM